MIAAAIAFFGAACLFSVNGAWADANHANGLLKVVGGLCWLSVLVWIVYKYVKQGGNPNRG